MTYYGEYNYEQCAVLCKGGNYGAEKEEPSVYRACIADAAERLFLKKGILETTVDDIAEAAKYSKATIYVYFKSKEEIIDMLVLKSMKQLYERVNAVMLECEDTRICYQMLCIELVRYQEAFPLYFELILDEINVGFNEPNALPIKEEIFQVSEQLTGLVSAFFIKGIAEKVLREDIPIPQTVFLFWASLSGMIKMAQKKEWYIQNVMDITKKQFLEDGFETLFRSISRDGGSGKECK